VSDGIQFTVKKCLTLRQSSEGVLARSQFDFFAAEVAVSEKKSGMTRREAANHN